MKKRSILVLIVAIMILSGGCRQKADTSVQQNVITEITITCQSETELIQRRYTSSDKMRSVLLYIRSLHAHFDAPEPPKEDAGYLVSITTVSADKTTKVYRQQGNRYFQAGENPWQIIDSEKGANLWMIIKLLPSDPE